VEGPGEGVGRKAEISSYKSAKVVAEILCCLSFRKGPGRGLLSPLMIPVLTNACWYHAGGDAQRKDAA